MWVGGWGLAICVQVGGLGGGGWRFVYRYVGWGLPPVQVPTVCMEPHIILQHVRIKSAAVDCLLEAPLEIHRRKQTMSTGSLTWFRITVGSDLEKWHNVGMLVKVNYEC